MRLNQSLSRKPSRRLGTCVITRTDGRAFRPPNYLAVACRCLNQALRLSQRRARADPHLFGPHAARYYQDTVQAARREAEIEVALRKVYGPSQPGDPPRGPGVWTRRYALDPQWRGFRKWFREQYGD